MYKRYEIVNFDSNMPIKCTMRRFGYIEPHLQDFFEVDLILSGRCQLTVEDQIYTLNAEDVVSIDGHVSHSLHSADCVFICVQFEQSLFERTLPNPEHPRFFCNSAVQGSSAAFDTLRRLIALLVKNNADRHTGYELRNWSLIYELMDVMYNSFRLDDTSAHVRKAHRYASRITEFSRIINDSFRDNFTLTQMAEKVHLSVPYLSRFFDQNFGMNFSAYLTQVRLNHAVMELMQTDYNIETISADSGFPNSHAFVQAFKKSYDMLPSVYRRQNRKPETPDVILPEQHDYMAGLKKYLTIPRSTSALPPSVSGSGRCDVSRPVRTLRHTWRNLLGVTSAEALLYEDVRKALRTVQEHVGFRYVKFNGIFSDGMRIYCPSPSGQVHYSFSYADKVFDFLRSVHLKPMVQLTFMPEVLAKYPQRRVLGYLCSEPANLDAWVHMVKALIGHLLDRYGREEVRSWRFTVWDQPDNLFKFTRDEDFFEFFRRTYQVVKQCDQALQVGSPPTFYILREGHRNWYLDFWSWCRKNRCVPDYLNFHYYDTTLLDSGSTGKEAFGFPDTMMLRDTPDGLSRFANQAYAERESLPEHPPIHLTEWNNTPSQQDLLSDTCFKSCYIVKSVLENYDRLESFGYWSLIDWMGESCEPKEMFFGGLGLFTTQGIPKAGYYAFTLLRQLGDQFLGSGDGWFATRSEGGYQLLLYNYRHFSHLYAMGERFDMTFRDRYTPFAPEQTLDMHITLENVKNGKYLVKETVLNRKSGSSFDLWNSMGAVELDDVEDIEYLTKRSIPDRNMYTTEAVRNTLEIDAMLDMLEVRLIILRSVN